MTTGPRRTKDCPDCGQTLPYTSFGEVRSNRDGLQCRCKACHRIRAQQANPHRNPLRKLHYELAGGCKEYYALPDADRTQIRATVRARLNLNDVPATATVTPLRPRLRSTASQLLYPTIRKVGEAIKKAVKRLTTRRAPNKAGFVYIIWHQVQYELEGVVKIGMTSDLLRRIGAANTWSFSGSFEYALYVPVSNMRNAEASLHRLFDASREHGEWFRIDVGTARMNLHLIADEFPLCPTTHQLENNS